MVRTFVHRVEHPAQVAPRDDRVPKERSLKGKERVTFERSSLAVQLRRIDTEGSKPTRGQSTVLDRHRAVSAVEVPAQIEGERSIVWLIAVDVSGTTMGVAIAA